MSEIKEQGGGREKLGGIEEGENKTIIDTEPSPESANPVQNKAVDAAIKSLGAAVIIRDIATDRAENVLWVKPGGVS